MIFVIFFHLQRHVGDVIYETPHSSTPQLKCSFYFLLYVMHIASSQSNNGTLYYSVPMCMHIVYQYRIHFLHQHNLIYTVLLYSILLNYWIHQCNKCTWHERINIVTCVRNVYSNSLTVTKRIKHFDIIMFRGILTLGFSFLRLMQCTGRCVTSDKCLQVAYWLKKGAGNTKIHIKLCKGREQIWWHEEIIRYIRKGNL